MRVEKLSEEHYQIPETESNRNADPDKRNLFVGMMQSLSSQQREVLNLVFYHDLTLDEIATLIGLSIGTVRTHYERGKEHFKKLLIQYKLDTK